MSGPRLGVPSIRIHPRTAPRFPDALCAVHPDLPWIVDGNPAEEMQDPAVRRALTLCGLCPHLHPCLQHGWDEPDHIYGGLTAAQRAALRRAQRGER